MSKKLSHISLLLIIIANTSPVFAAPRNQNADLSLQISNYETNSQGVIVTGLFDDAIKIIDTTDKTRRRIERRRRREQERKQRLRQRQIRFEMQQREREQRLRERQAREEERKRRQEELAAARRAATERQIQEAERRRQYFNSLSPAQKQAYIKKQQEIRQKQVAANLLILGLFAEFLIGSNGENSSQQQTPKYRDIDNTPRPSYNPAPASTKPIHTNYGSCHHYSC